MCRSMTDVTQIGEVFVNTGGGSPAVSDRPDDEGLAAFDIPGGENAGDVRHFICINCNEAPGVQRHPEL